MVWNWGRDFRIRKRLPGWETFGQWLVRGRETRAQQGFLRWRGFGIGVGRSNFKIGLGNGISLVSAFFGQF